MHDLAAYPLVHFVGDTTVAGYATRWCEEMDQLLAGSQPFVLIYPPGERDEAHQDRVIRGGWLKRNKARLADICLALIVIEPDAARRADLEAMFPNLVKAFGTPQAARGSASEAEALARHLLEGGGLETA
ncbi:GntR family transcriptional regulator [Xaviernesmea oryzae]|uniref:GntR family transcriptional regulator n=1 Tax=Xaviernesmea oryzae TaxID=464029 RepID=UPI001115209E|nr:GntR family transcriptional regulator [Xaviernesmea oryzae]